MCKRIMVVDDSILMRMMLKDILTKQGYEVAGEAENGVKAIAMYILLKPDMITMDINMPEMNGIEALDKILAIDPNARIIMVSSVINNEPVKKALQAGALDFVVKPFSKYRLLRAIEKALSKSTG